MHTSPEACGKVFSLVKPRMGALWHTLLLPPVVNAALADLRKVYDGPVVQTQDLSQWSPPSPDPSGLAYVESSGWLMMVEPTRLTRDLRNLLYGPETNAWLEDES